MKALAGEMKRANYSEEMMNKWANLFARHAINRTKPVLLTIVRKGEAVTFDFPHSFNEEKLKTFIIANRKGSSLDELQDLYSHLRYNTSGRNK